MKANIGKLLRKVVVLGLLLASFIYVSSAPQTASANWCPDWQVCPFNHYWDCFESQCKCNCPTIIYDPETWEPIGEYCPDGCA